MELSTGLALGFLVLITLRTCAGCANLHYDGSAGLFLSVSYINHARCGLVGRRQ
jgi:hypothetical protein